MMTYQPTVKFHRPHRTQKEVLDNCARFNVLKCGRRWGKSALATNLVLKYVLEGKRVAYFGPTYKDNFEIWKKIKYRLHDVISNVLEVDRRLEAITGGVLDMWSMENPDSGRGRAYHRVIIDECEKALKFQEAWEQAIRPTLTDYRGDCWMLSTPKFGKTYFKELFRKAPEWEEWAAFKYTAYDNPFISNEELDSIRRTYNLMVFRCEYLADDVDLSLNPFAYAFNKERHICEIEYDDLEPVQLSFDFNVDPITCLAAQSYETGSLNVIQEFRLADSNIYELCDRIKAAFPEAIFMVTGDATGRARSAITTGNLNYYRVIKEQLQLADTQMRQPTANPSVKNTRVLLNSLFQNGQVKIDKHCEYLIEDLIYCETDEEGDLDKGKDKHRSHLLDCLRYVCNSFHKDFIKYAEFV